MEMSTSSPSIARNLLYVEVRYAGFNLGKVFCRFRDDEGGKELSEEIVVAVPVGRDGSR
jgi:hypothetical protein